MDIVWLRKLQWLSPVYAWPLTHLCLPKFLRQVNKKKVWQLHRELLMVVRGDWLNETTNTGRRCYLNFHSTRVNSWRNNGGGGYPNRKTKKNRPDVFRAMYSERVKATIHVPVACNACYHKESGHFLLFSISFRATILVNVILLSTFRFLDIILYQGRSGGIFWTHKDQRSQWGCRKMTQTRPTNLVTVI